MNTVTLFVFCVLFVIIEGQKFDQLCKSNDDCIGENYGCINGQCGCKPGYRYEGDKPITRSNTQPVCSKVFGSNCQSNKECENLKGAICEDHKCICEAGIAASDLECVPVDYVNKTCTMNAQCVRIVDDNSICGAEKKCICKQSYHLSTDYKKCLQNSGIGEDCSKENNCYMDVDNKNALECRDNACHCKPGYEEIEDTCKGGATTVIVSMLTMVLFVFGVLRAW